jgi:hypothetical protein
MSDRMEGANTAKIACSKLMVGCLPKNQGIGI